MTGYTYKGAVDMSTGNKKSKKPLLFVILAILVLAGLFLLYNAKKEADSDKLFTMSTNAERVGYLNSKGWIVNPDPISTTDIVIPSEFNDTYKSYNDLQLSQGFDLSQYKGKEAVLYTYEVLNYPDYPKNVVANLVVINDRLVAADITLQGENGFTAGISDS
jgi:hypothetical protein